MNSSVTAENIQRFNRYVAGQEDTFLSNKTGQWSRLFDQRQSILDLEVGAQLNALDQFLAGNSKQATGTGHYSLEKGFVEEDLATYVLDHLDVAYLSQFEPSFVGNPPRLRLGAHEVNMAYIWNLLRFQTYYQVLIEKGLLGDGLDALEIGPGYGAAALMWIQSGRIKSYTIVDLKENLINSVYYLSENLPDWKFRFVESSEDIDKNRNKTIYFLTPQHLDDVDSQIHFDLAVNSDSFGEMTAPAALGYIDWIHRKLKDDGLFISMNGHRRGQSKFEGVLQVSGYGYQRFELIEFFAKPFCTSAFDDFGHVALLRKSDLKWSANQERFVDTLANLYTCGLTTDVRELSRRFSADSLTEEDVRFLEACDSIFRGGDPRYEGEFKHITSYLRQLRRSTSATPDKAGLRQYLTDGHSAIARLYCYLLLFAVGDGDVIKMAQNDRSPAVQFYLKEFLRYSRLNPLFRRAAFRMRMDNIRKKVNPYTPYRPSPLIRFKNVVFNLREGGKLTTFRG